jgi:Sec-independent protein translocase protein TatA
MIPPHGGMASIGLPQLLMIFLLAIFIFGVSRLNR